MSLKSINVKNIKFSDYDQTIVDIKSTKEGLMLKALNKLGTTKLKATYQDKTAEITLSVFSDYISSAKLFSDNYYVYLDDKTDLSLDTNPENVEAGFFDVFVDDENIATIKDLIRKDFGISILSKSACMDEVTKKKLTILPIKDLSMERQNYVIYSNFSNNLSIIEQIVKSYQDEYKQLEQN